MKTVQIIFWFLCISLSFSSELIFFGSGIHSNGSVMDYLETDSHWKISGLTIFNNYEPYPEPIIFPLVASYPGGQYKITFKEAIASIDGFYSVFNFNKFSYITKKYKVKKLGAPSQKVVYLTKKIVSPYITPLLKQYVEKSDIGSRISSYQIKQCFCTKVDEKPLSFEFSANVDNHGEYYLNGQYIGSSRLERYNSEPFDFTARQDQLRIGINCLKIKVKNHDHITGVSLVGTIKRNKINKNVKWRVKDGKDVCLKIKPDKA